MRHENLADNFFAPKQCSRAARKPGGKLWPAVNLATREPNLATLQPTACVSALLTKHYSISIMYCLGQSFVSPNCHRVLTASRVKLICNLGMCSTPEYGGGCKVKCAKMHCYLTQKRVPWGQTHSWVRLIWNPGKNYRNLSPKCLSDSDSGWVWPPRSLFRVKFDPGVFRVYDNSNAFWHISLYTHPHIQVCCTSPNCVIITNGTSL